MKGRKPKPTALKQLAGNPGHRPLNKAEAQPRRELPQCPHHLQGDARKEWHRIARELYDAGLLTSVDRAALAGYCAAYGHWVEAEKMIEEQGLTVESPNGYPMQAPWVGIANNAMKQMKAFLVEFGMTPSSRARIHVEKPEGPDELEQLFQRTGKKIEIISE